MSLPKIKKKKTVNTTHTLSGRIVSHCYIQKSNKQWVILHVPLKNRDLMPSEKLSGELTFSDINIGVSSASHTVTE